MRTRLSLLGVLVVAALVPATTASAAIPGPVASWGFDERSGTATADATGGGLTGALDGPTWAAGGRFGAALSFDGVNDSVSVADSDALDLTTGMTLEAWVRPSALDGWRSVILKERPGDLAYALYGSSGANRPAAHIWTTSDLGLAGSAALAPNAWTHLAATYDGATLRLYVNGTQATTLAAAPPIQVSGNPLRLGGNAVWGEYFDGLIDEVRIYDRALSAAEVQGDIALAVNGGTPPPPDTTAPTVSITAPAGGATVSGSSVAVNATAGDNIGVAGVQLRLDGAALGAEDTTAPYSTTWNTTTASNGSHTLTAVARDAAANTTTSTAVTVTVDNTGPPPPPPPPPPGPGPTQVGQWSGVINFPLVPVHMTPMADGKIVMWDGFEFAPDSERLFDPQTLTFTPIANEGRNLFCAVNVKLPDGRLMSAGGHSSGTAGTTELNLYNPTTRQWTSGPPMARARWYPSSTQLADGRQFVIAGDDNNLQLGQPFPLRDASDTVPEIYDPAANSWSSVPSAARRIPWYPFMFLLSDGRLFDAGPDQVTRTLDLSTGTWSFVGTSPVEGHSAVMYRPGKILKSGNYGDTSTPGRTATGRAATIDMNEASPTWREISSMKRARTYHTLTALPDGTVMASGGSTESTGTDPAGAVKDPEIWDPVTDTWSLVAPSQRPRLYHSSATLLQDGRVLLAGGGRLYDMPNEPNGEIYSPPYLSKGPRPTIASAPGTVTRGSTFAIDTPDATSIQSVSLMRMSSITHNVDQDQRFQFLTFSQRPGGLNIDLPANPNVVPPGVYQLFILSDQGVPSVAKIITVPVPGADLTPPSPPSNLNAPGELGRAQLSWTAATDNVGIVQYRVHRSTTAGFAPSDANRIATVGATTSYGDATVSGGTTYRYRIVAADAAGNASAPSGEATAVIPTDTAAPTVSITAPANGATVSGSSVAVSTTASDDVAVSGVQLRLDGAALGAEDTTAPYTATWNTTTASNGTHTLTAVARDSAANTTTSTAVTVTVDNTGPPPPPPPTGLVAAYGFDEPNGATAVDGSGLANAGTIKGPLRTATGRFGGALTFDGVDDLVTVGDAASLDLTTGMTLEAWVNPSSVAGWRTTILKEQPGNLVYSLYAGGSPAAPSTHVFTTADVDANGSAALAVNAWSHLAATYDGTTLRMFVNGAQVGTRAPNGPIAVSTGALQIGGNSVWGEWFAGVLDEVRVYNKALTAAQIQADMTTPVSGGPASAASSSASTARRSAPRTAPRPTPRPGTRRPRATARTRSPRSPATPRRTARPPRPSR